MTSSSQDTYLLAMPSNYDTTFMDAYLHAVVSYYDELYGHLHWFNLSQKQLLQAICDDASEADLRARLDSTLLEITDGANEEEGDFAELTWEERMNGKVKLGPESPDVLARGRVYDKALGEARHNIRIEKFLVMELEKDANLTDYLSLNLPEVRRLKIACWAATCNLVHMVMGLLNCRGEGDRKFFLYRVLNIAVEFGYVELVERLVELVDAELVGEVSGFFYAFDNDFEDIFLRGMGKRNKRIDYKSGCLYYYAFRDKLEPIELAAKLENVEMVNTLLACQKDPFRYTNPLHWAVKMRNVEVVNAILGNEEKKFDVNALYSMTVGSRMVKRYRCDTVFIGWDGSRIGPFDVVRFTPLQLATLIGPIDVVEALCNDPKGRLGATIENCDGVTALQIATEMRNDDVVKILTDIPEVAKDVKRLYRDRQVHVDAANAILVGAALISSVTFAGWLQPPLAYSPFFGSASLDAGAPPPSGMYPSFVSVEGHPIMKIFWVFNSLSFFFAIATLMVGATAARPPKKETYIGVVVQSLRTSLRLAYALLTVSVACVMGAFASAGFVVLPPIHSYTTVMRATVSIGVMVVFLAWTPSTVCKIVTSIQTRIQRRGRKIYYRYRPILAPIMKILDRIKKIVDLIKEKIQLD